MKEWDLDSYNRKFSKTLTYVMYKGNPLCTFVEGVVEVANGKHSIVNHDRPDLDVVTTPFIYKRVPASYYEDDGLVYCVRRRLNKSWKIGINGDETHKFTFHDDEKSWRNLRLQPAKIEVEKALKQRGLISNRIYISPGVVYYLGENLGIRKGSKFLVDSQIEQEVKDALLGFKCSINP